MLNLKSNMDRFIVKGELCTNITELFKIQYG